MIGVARINHCFRVRVTGAGRLAGDVAVGYIDARSIMPVFTCSD